MMSLEILFAHEYLDCLLVSGLIWVFYLLGDQASLLLELVSAIRVVRGRELLFL